MNLDLVIEIVQLAVGLYDYGSKGTPMKTGPPAQALLQIIQNAAQVYQQQTGAPLDPSLIKVEDAV